MLMQRYKFVLLFLTAGLLTFHFQSFSQETEEIKWYNPAVAGKQVIQGQAWFNELKNPYDRLPAKAEDDVRTAVWNGSLKLK